MEIRGKVVKGSEGANNHEEKRNAAQHEKAQRNKTATEGELSVTAPIRPAREETASAFQSRIDICRKNLFHLRQDEGSADLALLLGKKGEKGCQRAFDG
jgi:hypothetical protein